MSPRSTDDLLPLSPARLRRLADDLGASGAVEMAALVRRVAGEVERGPRAASGYASALAACGATGPAAAVWRGLGLE